MNGRQRNTTNAQIGWKKKTRIMMATVPHVTAWAGRTKYHTDGFLFDWVYMDCVPWPAKYTCHYNSSISDVHYTGDSRLWAAAAAFYAHWVPRICCITLWRFISDYVNFWALQIEEMPKLINCESKFFKIKTMQYVNCQTVQLEKHCLIAQVSFIKYGNDSW